VPPFDSLDTVSYLTSIATMAVSCTVSEIHRSHGRQRDREIDKKTDRQKDRQTDRQISVGRMRHKTHADTYKVNFVMTL